MLIGEAIPGDSLTIIKGYIENLKVRYNVSIVIDDLIGISCIYPDFDKIFSSSSYHNNQFCNYIKKSPLGFTRCIQNKCKVSAHCENFEGCSFFGKCHMGVEEFVFPVKWNGKLIAMLFVGEFYTSEANSSAIIEKKASALGLDPSTCKNLYFDVARKIDFSVNEFFYDLGMLGQYILQLAINYFTQGQWLVDKANALENSANINNTNFTVSKTVDFIKENYDKELSLSILSSNVYCNATYLSHIFKEKLNVSVVDYINQVRVDHAKHLLDVTTKTVIEISLLVGYRESSYFTKVFRQVSGMSPKEYRARKTVK